LQNRLWSPAGKQPRNMVHKTPACQSPESAA
jgi:hypothetical protein